MRKFVLLSVIFILALTACGGSEKAVQYESKSIEAGKTEEKTGVKAEEKERTEEKEETAVANGEYFVWSKSDENTIVGLTDAGKKQKSLIIPANCVEIDGGTFNDSKVEKITFEDDDNVEIRTAFSQAPNLKTVILPAHQKEIGYSAFGLCDSIESMRIPSEVETIGKQAFASMAGLREIIFEGTSVKSIEKMAFEISDSLEIIVLPEGLESIGDKAFKDCNALKTLNIPSTVKSIGSRIIESTSITEIHIPAEVELPDLPKDAFANIYTGTPVTVYIVKDSWMDKNRQLLDVAAVYVEYEK